MQSPQSLQLSQAGIPPATGVWQQGMVSQQAGSLAAAEGCQQLLVQAAWASQTAPLQQQGMVLAALPAAAQACG